MQKGQDRGWWVGWDSVAICGLSFGNTLVGTRWTVLCTNRLKKQSSHLVGPHIPSSEVVFFSQSGRAIAGQEPCKLVNEWVWFESRMCRG